MHVMTQAVCELRNDNEELNQLLKGKPLLF